MTAAAPLAPAPYPRFSDGEMLRRRAAVEAVMAELVRRAIEEAA